MLMSQFYVNMEIRQSSVEHAWFFKYVFENFSYGNFNAKYFPVVVDFYQAGWKKILQSSCEAKVWMQHEPGNTMVDTAWTLYKFL